MASKRYPDPKKQIEAGYFWLIIGLLISVILAWIKPTDNFLFMWGLVVYGLFHLFSGRKHLREELELENARIDRYLKEDLKFIDDFE